MQHKRTSSDFTNQFIEILNLTEDQVNKIDEFEYQSYKNYTWSYATDGRKFKFQFIRQMMSVLTSNQISKLKEYRNEQIAKTQSAKEEEWKRYFEYEKERLSLLDLSNDQLYKYVEINFNRSDLVVEYYKLNPELKKSDFPHFEQIFKQDYIYPIFNEQQLLKYKLLNIREEEKYQIERINHHKLIYQNAHNITLTDLQSSKILDLEDKQPLRNTKGQFYSEFENAVWKLRKMKKILGAEQYQIYKIQHDKEIFLIEDELRESNLGQHAVQLSNSMKLIEYYIKHILPKKCKSRLEIEVELQSHQNELIHSIREEYFAKLDEFRNKRTKEHFKYNKDLVPNALKTFYYRNDIDRIKPNAGFLSQSEKVKYLMTKDVMKLVEKYEMQSEQLDEDMIKFRMHLYEKTGGVYGPSLIKIPAKEKELYLKYVEILILEPSIKANLLKLKMR